MCQSVNKRKSLSELERTQKDNDLREKLLSFAINMPDEDNLKSLQVLLKDGANPVITSEKGTRMLQGFLQTLSDDVRVATCLLQYTARGQLKGDIDGGLFERLIEAIQKKKRDDLDKLVKLLIDAMWSEQLTIKTDTKGWTAVMWAARKGKPNIARALIGSAEYAPEEVNYVGSALHMAAKQGSTDTIEILLAHPNVNVDTRSKVCNIMRRFIFRSNVRIAMQGKRFHINPFTCARVSQKVNNLTPLHFACVEDHLDVVEQLLNRGADPCSKDWENHMPVDKVITRAENADAIKKALEDAAKRKYETTCDQLPTEPVR
eukprot:g3788.t1